MVLASADTPLHFVWAEAHTTEIHNLSVCSQSAGHNSIRKLRCIKSSPPQFSHSRSRHLAAATDYDLYYLGGQSNMDGYGRVGRTPR